MIQKSKIVPGADRALLIVDMIAGRPLNGLVDLEIAKVAEMIRGEAEYFRKKGRPILILQSNKNRDNYSDYCDNFNTLIPVKAGDIFMRKSGFSCFFETDLLSRLKALGVRQLTLAGMQTHTSILSTAIDASAHGFQVAAPQTCVYSSDPNKHEMALKLIREDFSSPDFSDIQEKR